MVKTSATPVTDKVRELLLGIVIMAGKSEQKNSGAYPAYLAESKKEPA